MGALSHIETATISIFNKKINVSKSLLCIVFFLMLFIEMGLRGDFCVDTIQYNTIFKSNPFNTSYSIFKLSNPNALYGLIWIVNFFSGNYLVLLCSIAIVIALCYTIFTHKESEIYWLSVLVLLCSGSFYTGFNVMRQFWAAACFACCIGFIYKGEFWKYLVSILILSQIHFSTR